MTSRVKAERSTVFAYNQSFHVWIESHFKLLERHGVCVVEDVMAAHATAQQIGL